MSLFDVHFKSVIGQNEVYPLLTSGSSRKRTPSEREKGVRHRSWPLTRMAGRLAGAYSTNNKNIGNEQQIPPY